MPGGYGYASVRPDPGPRFLRSQGMSGKEGGSTAAPSRLSPRSVNYATKASFDGKIVTFTQAEAPTAYGTGDVWYDSDDDNHMYRWDGTTWVSQRDGTIATAQASADVKNTVFRQATPPTALATGDIWFDSDDGDRVFSWDGGTWIDVLSTAVDSIVSNMVVAGDILASHLTVAALSAITADIGTITAGQISVGNFTISAATQRILLGATAFMTGAAGVFLGLDTVHKFRVGDPATNFFNFDGTNLNVGGTLIGSGLIITGATQFSDDLTLVGASLTLSGNSLSQIVVQGNVNFDASVQVIESGSGGGELFYDGGTNLVKIRTGSNPASMSDAISIARDTQVVTFANTITGAISGNAATATVLATARTINGVSFNGSANITVTAAAGTLSGATLASGVTGSSLTSLGTLTGLTVGGTLSVNSSLIRFTGAAPKLEYVESDASANEQVWDFVLESEQMRFRILNDARSVNANWITVDRSGTSVTDVKVYGTAFSIAGNLNHDGANIGLFGTAPTSKKTVTGSRGGNAALASLLGQLALYGLITDSTSA